MTRRGTKKCALDFCQRRVNPIFLEDGEKYCGTHRHVISMAKCMIEVMTKTLEPEGLTLSDVLKL